VYYYDYDDVQTPGSGPSLTDPNDASVSTFAVPDSYMIGFDTDAVWLVTDRITLGGNFSYTKSEYDSDFSLIDNFDPQKPNSLFVATSNVINIDGNQMQRIPEYKGGAWGQYNWPLGPRGSVELFTSWTWIDEVYFSPFEDDRDSSDSYSRWDARATWRSPDESWTVAAFMNNILDEIGIRQIDRNSESFNYMRSGATTDPRLYGMEVRYKFNSFP
jgi:iron complex outermembrane receptor protein